MQTTAPEGVLLAAAAEYAQVLRMLGNGRLEAMCIDSTKRLCHIRGKMRKKVWVNTVSAAACNLARDSKGLGVYTR
jgi:initiation factor 1A